MNKLNLLMLLAIAAVPLSVSAADGTISFSGEVLDTTCQINGGTEDIAVTLPKVNKTALALAGAVSGRTPFAINLTGCGLGPGERVAAYFEVGPTVNVAGRLINAGSASNVQIQLLDNAHTAIPILGDIGDVAWATPDVSGNASLAFFAEYYATAAATAGTVVSSVQYTIVYE